ncbi:MAG: UDP-N-acetylmuramoyl-L-alanyl-D-glutamate--2,6-diaminopimelate ligase, partial [bacterium]|nr:UDP-N-acetylmuramoyl-L-alanyl-D-glutamate--2,6-diaminopimelate ligase [bacterium]
MRYLDQLLEGIDILGSSGDLHIPVYGIQLDSRKIEPGHCFVAIRGHKENGLAYLGSAIARGAGAIVFESNPEETLPEIPLTHSWVLVKNARRVISKMAARFYGHVADPMYITGITGTNGKTTIASLIHDIYNRESATARIGTLGMVCNGLENETGLTTPESIDIFRFLSQAGEKGCQNLVIEASSIALQLHRLDNIHFSQAIFTNFTGDHLDFHETMDNYFESKLLLFKRLGMDDWAVINADDPNAPKVLEQLESKYLTYGFSEDADVRPIKYKFSLTGIDAMLKTPKGNVPVKSRLVGRVNLSNIMAAVTSSVIKGLPLEEISGALRDFQPVKGRMDTVYQGDFSVMIDFAHTDKALEGMLESLRELVKERIILVFGAGGAKDKSKRPRMGKVASQLAHELVLTSDNPRSEEPMDIIDDVATGFVPGFETAVKEPDREKAIITAIHMAKKGDLVVIAGKGHEDYQIFKDKTIHFDDYEIVRTALDTKRTALDTKRTALDTKRTTLDTERTAV